MGISTVVTQPSSGSSTLGSTPVDVNVLKEFQAKLGEDGAEVVADLVAIFLDDTPKLLKELQVHLAQENMEGFQRSAHTLKGNSATFGAMGMFALCRELEAMGRAGTLQGAAVKMAQVEAEFERVRTVLAELYPSISSYSV
jgi:two-component system sensor histidine kinase/response regulator